MVHTNTIITNTLTSQQHYYATVSTLAVPPSLSTVAVYETEVIKI